MTPTPESQPPPSIAFVSFRSAIQNLRDHGLPETLDRSAWNTRSGTEQTQIVSGLKFFGLTDDKGNTQPSLKELVGTAENSDQERACWSKLLRQSYPGVFKVDLANATPKQLDDAIGAFSVAGLTKERAIRFFLKAAMHAKIKLSTRLTGHLRDRSSTPSDAGSSKLEPLKPMGRRSRLSGSGRSVRPLIHLASIHQDMKTEAMAPQR